LTGCPEPSYTASLKGSMELSLLIAYNLIRVEMEQVPLKLETLAWSEGGRT